MNWWYIEAATIGIAAILILRAYGIGNRERRGFLERESVLEALLEGVVSLDGEGRVEYVNPCAARMLSAFRKDLLNKPLQGPSSLVEKSLALLATCRKMGIPVTDSVTVHAEKKMYLDLVAIPKEHGIFLVLQDRSSQQQVLEVGKDFVANASHELKTPITIIRGFTETLQDMKELPREMVDDILEKIVRNCQRMESLVRNLLTLADIENLPFLNCHPCEIGGLLRECIRATLAVNAMAEIELVEETQATAEVDSEILELAFLNILENAVKYSASPAQVRVRVRQDAQNVTVLISDKGAGIPPQDIEHIFERFYTVNKAHSRKLGGAGLGLSLVKKIIEKHNGLLEVHSVLGEGSTFTILIPRWSKY